MAQVFTDLNEIVRVVILTVEIIKLSFSFVFCYPYFETCYKCFIFRMRCTLYGFITDYVKDIFIEEILFDIREKLREVTQGKMKC